MDGQIKSTTIPLTGYVYQNLVGIGLLCDWLDDPTSYKWIKFEAEDEVAKGLDDIVALHKDDTYSLFQVKFTVNSEDSNNALNWRWLLGRTAKGKSNLQKWVDAFFSLEIETVKTAALITNRKPDRDFENQLDASSNRLRFNNVTKMHRDEVIEQIGIQKAEIFFSSFEFRHSYQGFISLERSLQNRLIPHHTTGEGWLNLFRDAIDWAVRKGFPKPDGKITLNILRSTIDQRRPKPLVQSFRIPEGYLPPNKEFTEQFIESISKQRSNSVVLWGAPGQGKSTFISYICDKLSEQKVPYIRHHYFLDLQDQSDRFTLGSVANSLISQMEIRHLNHVKGLNTNADQLRDWILRCADGYKQEGKPFVIVIDGLDHVWRENDRNKETLDSLFKTILPVPENVVLLIGTQKVSAEQLPHNFDRFIPENSWIELPKMSLLSIKGWLTSMYDSKRFEFPEHAKKNEENALTELSKAFESSTSGHPLILTYTFEELAREHRVLTPGLVTRNTTFLPKDITDYYRTLWANLSFQAKDALYLAAEAGFVWPVLGLEACLNVATGELRKQIGHLFYQTEIGEMAFHGSLFVFVQAISEYAERAVLLRPKILDWLETSAPGYLRWGWLWIYKARLGDTTDLLTLPNRIWLINSLAKAYPTAQIIKIYEEAETIAVTSKQYALAVRLRWLKQRLINGPQYQIEDYDRLHQCALHLTDDNYPIAFLSSEIHLADVDDLYLLGKQFLNRGRTEDAKKCFHDLRVRINDRIRAGDYDNKSFQADVEKYFELAAGTKDYEPENIIQLIRQRGRNNQADTFTVFLSALLKHQDINLLMDFVSLPNPLVMRKELELSCIRLAGHLGIKLHEWQEFRYFRKHPLSDLWRLIFNRHSYTPKPLKVYCPAMDVERHSADKSLTENYLHTLFFKCIAATIFSGVKNSFQAPDYAKRPWLTIAVSHIQNVADSIGAVISRGDTPRFDLPFRLIEPVEQPSNYDFHADYIAFRNAIMAISFDLFLICNSSSSTRKIPKADWAKALNSKHFVSEIWCEKYLVQGFDILDVSSAEEHIKQSRQVLKISVGPLNERAQSYLELCELAIKFGLNDLAKELLSQTFGCVMGYGWRKDLALTSVIDSIEYMVPIEPEFAKQMLIRVAPIMNRIGDMTEDDGVKESHLAWSLLRLMPSCYVSFYRHWLKKERWYLAELVFAELLEFKSLSEPLMGFVTCAIWSPHEVEKLKGLAEANDPIAAEIILKSCERFGLTEQALGKDVYSSKNEKEDEFEVVVADYPPEKFSELLAELKSLHAYMVEKRIVREWFQHWVSLKRGADILKQLELQISQESIHSAVLELLDSAFELSYKLQGARKAYKWLVVGQIERRGWGSYYYSGDEALRRFELIKKHYPADWQKFISDTLKPAKGWNQDDVVIPSERLIQYLLAVNQTELAKQVLQEMVEAIESDFGDLVLNSPEWLNDDQVNVMSPKHLADVGISRLLLPVPMAKLQVIHSASEELRVEGNKEIIWQAILDYIESCDLESDVLEALCICFSAKNESILSSASMRLAIKKPSILSDHFVSLIFDVPRLVMSWGKSHSGEAPGMLNTENSQRELRAGHLTPKILANRLLRHESNETPLMKQWAFEFEQINRDVESDESPSYSYFSGDSSREGEGQFAGRRSQIARSAYLRTIALAADVWGMPQTLALDEAMFATPVDFSFLKMMPGCPPARAEDFHQMPLDNPNDFPTTISAMVKYFGNQNDSRLLIHFDGSIHSSESLLVELELITTICTDDIVDPEEAFLIHNATLGKVYIPRNKEGVYILPVWPSNNVAPSSNGGTFSVALLPALSKHVGYLHSDIFQRMPYFPVCHQPGQRLVINPTYGGAEINLNDSKVGEFHYWNWEWQPMHLKGLKTKGAVALMIDPVSYNSMLGSYSNNIHRVWKAKIKRREKEHHSWVDETIFGVIN